MNLPESALTKIQNCRGDINVNVGSGTDTKPNFINFDWNPHVPELDINDDIKNIGNYFEDGTVTNIILFQVLEHFGREDWQPYLAKLCALIKPGGRIHIRVPSVVDLVDLYKRGHMTAEGMFWVIYGRQEIHKDTPELSDFHKSGVTDESITTELEKNGFIVEEINHIYGLGLIHVVGLKK